MGIERKHFVVALPLKTCISWVQDSGGSWVLRTGALLALSRSWGARPKASANWPREQLRGWGDAPAIPSGLMALKVLQRVCTGNGGAAALFLQGTGETGFRSQR